MYNPFSLIGKTILVTGASSGIGRAVAIECARMGAQVVLTARNEERLQETLSQMVGEGHQVITADLSTEEGILSLTDQLPTLDGVVLNAGIIGLAPISSITTEKLEKMQTINLNAPILLTRYLVKKRLLNKPASLVYMASAAGIYRVSVGNAIYAAAKSGLDAFVRTAALELASRGIRCNTINPAMVETEAVRQLAITVEQQEENLKQYPLHRYAQPQEVAYAAVYLLSEASAYMTGSAIKLDGGLTLS